MCEGKRKRERERVCEGKRKRERESVCVRERERERKRMRVHFYTMSPNMIERRRDRDRER